jgi:site-specific recombinase XerD
MPASSVPGPSIAAFTSQYDQYLLRVRGSADSTRRLHRYVTQQFLTSRFPNGLITWSDLRFSDCVAFVRKEFARLPSHDTQQTWLMILRSLLRYLADEVGAIPLGWDTALPRIANRRHARLPRQLSETQVQDLFGACPKNTPRHVRDRALLLVFLRLGLRREEVANLTVRDIDWRNGLLHIRSTKTYQDRNLPLPEDVGRAVVAHLRHQRPHPVRVFEPRQPPFTAERSYHHVGNTVRALLVRAGIVDRGVHALRHTAATTMVNGGASFKDVADILGHQSLATTLIYAKLDLRSLMQVALPWPGGGR